jgi:outer membrane protein TolC
MRFDLRAGGLAAAILIASGSAPLLAQSLTMGEVLASSRQHTPQVLEAIARVRAAEGRRLATDGAFDIVFKGDADSRLGGFYDGKSLGASVTRPLQTMGGELYAGYRVSDGRFPVYEDERFTNQLGELKAGVVFALLRDRLIDDRRFARNVADVDIELARNEQLMIAIGVQRRAMDAYGTWVAIGLRLEVLRALLALAEGRQDGLRGQVARGMKPTILLVENDQNILRRKALVVEAEQALSIAATRLSLYLRDETGLPVTPPPGRLPSALPPAPVPSDDARTLAAARPDLKAIDLRMQQARERLALTRNSALPRLDLVLETSRDFGDIGAGGRSRSGTDPRIGLQFSVPLQQRSAKGQLAATEAELDAQGLRRRQLEDQIGIELETIQTDIDATHRVVELALAEQGRATQLAAAERRRFELGASDLFLVQIREEAEASARIRAIESAWRETQARAELAAVTADLPALGL